MHAHSAQRETFARLTYLPDLLIPLAATAFVAFGHWALAGRLLSKIVTAGVLCSISLIVAETIKSQLKFAFGRLWPDTWVQNNPSFIHDGVYGFNLFHGGPGYASFPSGHTSATCAVILVVWIMYPKLRPLYALAVLAVTRQPGGRQLSLLQRRDRRRFRRHLDRLDDGRALAGAPIKRVNPPVATL